MSSNALFGFGVYTGEGEMDLEGTTPAERLAMMWQLSLDVWSFKEEPIAELRLPRHVVRLIRGGR